MGEPRAGYRLGVASVRHVFRFLALALILSGLFSGHFPRCANGQLTSAKRRELRESFSTPANMSVVECVLVIASMREREICLVNLFQFVQIVFMGVFKRSST